MYHSIFYLFVAIFHLVFDLTMFVIVAKSLIIGCEFNFYHWFKYGKTYTKWYKNRAEYMEKAFPNVYKKRNKKV